MARRTAGTLLILLGALGIVLSALGVVTIWRAADDVTVAADDALSVLSDTLTDVDRSVDVASSTLEGAALAIDGLYTTTLDVSETLSSTRVTIDEMAGLTEDELPQSIESSLLALEALEETAGVIDQLLRGLQIFGVGNYDPEIPLDQAVAEAGEGLEPVPESLRTMGAGLHETSASLEQVQDGIVLMGDYMKGIRQNAADADRALANHRRTLQDLQARVRAIRPNVGRPIRMVAWGATLLLIWIGLSQLAIVRWGVSLWRRRALRRGAPQDVGSGADTGA
jgi:methyl-accepting chemotaxis protein